MTFEWDRRKAASNVRKHGVTFADATSVFSDPLAMIFADEDHSLDERREIIVGHSNSGRLLMVAFTELEPECARIISARPLTRAEQRDHEIATT